MDPFWLRVALSALAAGATVAAFTAVAERQGSRLGGLLLTLPVKVMLALVLLGLSQGAAFAGAAARAVPAGVAANVVLLTTAALLLRRVPLWAAMTAGFALWTTASILILTLEAPGPLLGLVYWMAAAVAGLAAMQGAQALRGLHRGGRSPSARRFLIVRGLAAGGLVAAALVLGRVAGSFAAGLASVFPSAWMTALIALSRSQGPALAGATARVMVVGSVAPALFGAVCAATYGALGLLWGTLLAVLASGVATVLGGKALARWDARSIDRAGRALTLKD